MNINISKHNGIRIRDLKRTIDPSTFQPGVIIELDFDLQTMMNNETFGEDIKQLILERLEWLNTSTIS